MQLVSRKEAVEQRLRYYFTGVPCKNGHLQVRLTTGGCKDCGNSARVQRDKVNVESIRAYAQKPETRQMVRDARYLQYHAEPERFRAVHAWYRAERLKRVPAWADKEAIAEFYANCPEGYEVDHIIPLLGEMVSGLHVLGNLQYLTEAQNSSKGNRYTPC